MMPLLSRWANHHCRASSLRGSSTCCAAAKRCTDAWVRKELGIQDFQEKMKSDKKHTKAISGVARTARMHACVPQPLQKSFALQLLQPENTGSYLTTRGCEVLEAALTPALTILKIRRMLLMLLRYQRCRQSFHRRHLQVWEYLSLTFESMFWTK